MNKVTKGNSLLMAKQESDGVTIQQRASEKPHGLQDWFHNYGAHQNMRQSSSKGGEFKNNITRKQGSKDKFKCSHFLVNFS